jgi:hypothetical protein
MAALAFLGGLAILQWTSLVLSKNCRADDFVIYSVYQSLWLGDPNDHPQKDYYVNMGSSNGIRNGSYLEVVRKISTYDLLSEKLYKDMQFPIARLRVIHVEGNAAIARLDRFMPDEATPALSNHAVMVGDIVKLIP